MKKHKLIEVMEGFSDTTIASSDSIERLTAFARCLKNFYHEEGKTINLIIKSTEIKEI
jgi:hypothetical protein